MALLDNLVAYWKLDGNSNDAHGSNNGSDINITYSSANGKINDGAGFNGSSSYINVSSGLYALTDFTVSAWVKTTYAGSDDLYIYEQKNTTDSANIDFWIYSGKVLCSNWNGSTSPSVSSTSNVNDGNWHFVTATRSGATLKIYVDGVYENQNTTNTVTIGTYVGQIGRHPVYSHYFNGSIDEVGIWSRALSSTEVGELYNGGAGLSYPFTAGTMIKRWNGTAWEEKPLKRYNGSSWENVTIKRYNGSSWNEI